MRERWRYAFDNFIARGTTSMLLGLGVIFGAAVILFSVIVWVAGAVPEDAQGNFARVAWMSLMRTLDPGTMGGDSGLYGVIMLGVTAVGIFILSALIGILNSGLETRLDALRKGRSLVVEHDHTVILGWSEQIFTILGELAEANASRRNACVVILADRDKVEIEDEIRGKEINLKGTRVVCRQGSPTELSDLEIVNLDDARSIVVLSPASDNPDAEVIKCVLAIVNRQGRKAEPYHIVAELRDPRNVEVAKIAGKDEVEIVLVGDLIARIIAQTCRQPGLSIVYTELLDFGGDEIYFREQPELQGKPFSDSLAAYRDATVIGLAAAGKVPVLNPPHDTPLASGDRLIVIAADDDSITYAPPAASPVQVEAIAAGEPPAPAPERTLILGWNWRTPVIIRELDNYVAPGSTVTVLAECADGEQELARDAGSRRHLKVTFTPASPTDRATLDGLNLHTFNHIILLCSDTLPVQEADANTLITLLHLRDIAEKAGKPLTIVSEMLDIRNRNLAEVARVNDFIVSDKLISLMLTQISENKQLNAVFTDMFDPDGSEIYLKPATRYVKPGVPVNFFTVLESARRRGELAIGYKLAAQASDAEQAYGVKVNPVKDDTITFGEGDRIIVVAED